jgi:glycosyltransferase involved in cell wall biosynthesis
MIVGIFHPTLNICGGAEWVAVNIIKSLKNEGHRIVVLTNEKVNREKIIRTFGNEIKYDANIVFPLEFFPSTDFHNVYTDAIRVMLLKFRCDVLIDTQSNALLPGANITYIHFPLSGRLKISRSDRLRSSYYFFYKCYERVEARNSRRLVLANSKFTVNAIKKITGADCSLLYPPISNACHINPNEILEKENIVVSVSRISPGKLQATIPHIARLSNKKIKFLIIGLKESTSTLKQILESIKRNGVSDRVGVLTNISREELLKILRTSKVFLHPAHGEHFGIAIVEAMATGCIPIVHNSGGPVEFVPEPFRFNRLEQAARKIEKAIFEWSPQQAMRFVRIAQLFKEEKFSENFLKMFNSYVRRFYVNDNDNSN